MLYRFDGYRLDTQRLELWRDDTPVALEPQVFSLIQYLLENRHRVVGKEELIERIWQGRIVSDATLSSRINAARTAVGDSGKAQSIIRTVARRGFRFVAGVEEIASSGSLETDDPAVAMTSQSRGSARPRPWQLVLVLAIILLAAERIWDHYSRDAPEPLSAIDISNKPSLAVLPFTNLSGDSAQDYFADGLSEDIITELSRFGAFFVISRNSAFVYKGRAVNLRQVANELGVQYILEGGVRRQADRVRISVQLIDAEADAHVWAEKFDRRFEDVFAVQDEITAAIAARVAPEYLDAEMRRARRESSRNVDAWDRYLKGYWHLLRFSADDNRLAQHELQRAITLDASQANYHGVLAVTHLMNALYGWGESRETEMALALASAERGLALDDQDAQVVRSAGLVHFFDRRHDSAREYYRRAVELSPLEAENHALLGAAYGVAGEYEAAIGEIETALRLSPRDMHAATWYNNLAIAAFIAGRDQAAVEWAVKTIELNPGFPGGHRTLAASQARLGKLEEARASGAELLRLLPHLTLAQLRHSLPYFNDPQVLEQYLDGLAKAGIPN